LPHLAGFLKELATAGYFSAPGNTLTFEMRPYVECTERASVKRWLAMLDAAWALLLEERNGRCAS
jgi:hypothetical protein